MNPNYMGFLQSPQFSALSGGLGIANQMNNQNPYQPQQLSPMQMMPLMSLLHGMPGQMPQTPTSPNLPGLPSPGTNAPMGGMGAPFNQQPFNGYLNMIGQQPPFMGG